MDRVSSYRTILYSLYSSSVHAHGTQIQWEQDLIECTPLKMLYIEGRTFNRFWCVQLYSYLDSNQKKVTVCAKDILFIIYNHYNATHIHTASCVLLYNNQLWVLISMWAGC